MSEKIVQLNEEVIRRESSVEEALIEIVPGRRFCAPGGGHHGGSVGAARCLRPPVAVASNIISQLYRKRWQREHALYAKSFLSIQKLSTAKMRKIVLLPQGYDLRDYGKFPSVENQENYGSLSLNRRTTIPATTNMIPLAGGFRLLPTNFTVRKPPPNPAIFQTQDIQYLEESSNELFYGWKGNSVSMFRPDGNTLSGENFFEIMVPVTRKEDYLQIH